MGREGWQSAHDREQAELSLLATLMVQPNALGRVRRVLEPKHFTRGSRRQIYKACLDVADEGRPVDSSEVAAMLLPRAGAIADLTVYVQGGPAVPSRRLMALATLIARGGQAPAVPSAAQIGRVRRRTSIVPLVRERVPSLHRRGHYLVGLCPFPDQAVPHARRPSLRVFADSGLYYCTQCKEAGDVFSFAEHWSRTFTEAIRKLAKRAGVSLAPRGASVSTRT